MTTAIIVVSILGAFLGIATIISIYHDIDEIIKKRKEMKLKFKVGDTIRRKPLAQYNYVQPVKTIAKITEKLYVFKTDGSVREAIELFAQDEWELYSAKNWRRKVLDWFKKLFRYHQPPKDKLKYVGRQRKRPGQNVFEYNKLTGEIRVVSPKLNQVVMEPNCVYRQALNKKNFIKILKREKIWKNNEFTSAAPSAART